MEQNVIKHSTSFQLNYSTASGSHGAEPVIKPRTGSHGAEPI